MAAWVTLDAFRTFVGNDSTDDDALLQAAIDLACDEVDERCGPTLTATITEHVLGDEEALVLSCRATSLVSIAIFPSGSALDVSAYYVEGQLLRHKYGCEIETDLTVSYTSGAATPPTWAITAAEIIGKHLFLTRLRPTQNDPTAMSTFVVPKAALELMGPHLLASAGIA